MGLFCFYAARVCFCRHICWWPACKIVDFIDYFSWHGTWVLNRASSTDLLTFKVTMKKLLALVCFATMGMGAQAATLNGLNFNALNANALLVNSLTTNALTQNALTANALSNNALTNNAITSNAITSNAITSNAITSNALTGNALTENALTSNALPVSALAESPLTRLSRQAIAE
jgi:hypothetical protein